MTEVIDLTVGNRVSKVIDFLGTFVQRAEESSKRDYKKVI